MRKCVNGEIIDMTAEEIAELEEAKLTPEQEKMVRQIVERIYGPKTQQERNG